jgi:anthranilate synthase component 2
MQAIGEVFGGTLVNLSTVYHGISSEIRITVVDSIYRGMSGVFSAGRYHSWVVSPDNFPPCLEITSIDTLDGMIMSLRHRAYDLRGVQFHPESVLTPYGRQIIENWLKS